MSWFDKLFTFSHSHTCEFNNFAKVSKAAGYFFVCTHKDCNTVDPIEYEKLDRYASMASLAIDVKYQNRERYELFKRTADRQFEEMVKDLNDGFVRDNRVKYLIENKAILDDYLIRLELEPFDMESAFIHKVSKTRLEIPNNLE